MYIQTIQGCYEIRNMKFFLVLPYSVLLLSHLTRTLSSLVNGEETDDLSKVCGQAVHLYPHRNITLDVRKSAALRSGTDLIGTHIRCVIELITDDVFLIQTSLRYNPEVKGCNHGYLLVGNDRLRVGEETMTSYKFCDALWDMEIVSRGNYLWIVYDYDIKFIPNYMEIGAVALPKDACNETSFQCSPVQCIPSTSLCDGRIDCSNRRDEYCVSTLQDNPNDIQQSESACFMCEDGQCINPVRPRYFLDFDEPLGYICDGFSHCLDGTDERKDMCFRIKSKVSEMLKCVPISGRLRHYQVVVMWQDKICDGVQDCLNNEDERDCADKTSTVEVSAISTEPGALAIVLCASGLLLAWMIFFAYRTGNRCQRRRSERIDEQMTSRSRIIRSQESTDRMEVCRLQTVSEEPDDEKS